MSKKVITSIILCSSLLFVSGCGGKNIPEAEPVTGAEIETISTDIADPDGVTDQEMKQFFAKFLDISEESLLMLNQRPKEVDDEYWSVYRNYEVETNKIVGEYLSSTAKNKLKKQYLHDDFHFPRFIELNDYMVTGISNVSDAKITSKRVKEDSIVYEVRVIAMANVIDLNWARLKYKWDEEKGYYVEDNIVETDTYEGDEPGSDRIRVAMDYFVEVPDGDSFTVSSVREKTGLHLSMDEHGHMKNNNFITRLSFLNATIAKEEEVIHKFVDTFFKEDYNFYNYYRKAHDTDYDTFRLIFENDLGLADVVELQEDYKLQFEPSIIPLKDNMEGLSFDVMEDVVTIPHVSSSANLSTYQVTINADVLLINGQEVPYEYTYLFILDKERMITSVRLLTQQERDEDSIKETEDNELDSSEEDLDLGDEEL